MRVFLGEISSYKAIVIARHIRQCYPDVELWAYDSKPLLSVVHSRFVQHYVALQPCGGEQYVRQLAESVVKCEADILIPVHSDHIGNILRYKHLFGHTLDYVGTYESYIRLHEKDQLMNLASRCGLRVPRTYSSVEEACVPFVVKPTDKSSAKGVRYCMKESERKTLLSIPLEHTICQEYIEGAGCGYEIYCKDGQILQEYGHIRIAEFPVSGGSSVYRKRFIHPSMRPMAEAILREVPWTGFAMFEFKFTPSGELVLIEVNPRIWGSINQALQDGAHMFDNVIGTVLPRPAGKTPEVRTCLMPQAGLSMFCYLMKGNISPLKDYWHHHNQVYHDVSLISDPLAFLSMIIRKLL